MHINTEPGLMTNRGAMAPLLSPTAYFHCAPHVAPVLSAPSRLMLGEPAPGYPHHLAPTIHGLYSTIFCKYCCILTISVYITMHRSVQPHPLIKAVRVVFLQGLWFPPKNSQHCYFHYFLDLVLFKSNQLCMTPL